MSVLAIWQLMGVSGCHSCNHPWMTFCSFLRHAVVGMGIAVGKLVMTEDLGQVVYLPSVRNNFLGSLR